MFQFDKSASKFSFYTNAQFSFYAALNSKPTFSTLGNSVTTSSMRSSASGIGSRSTATKGSLEVEH